MSDIKTINYKWVDDDEEKEKKRIELFLEAQKNFADLSVSVLRSIAECSEKFLRDYLETYTPFVENARNKQEVVKHCPYCGKRIEGMRK